MPMLISSPKCQCQPPRQTTNVNPFTRQNALPTSPSLLLRLVVPVQVSFKIVQPLEYFVRCTSLGFDSHSAFSTRASSSFCLQPRLLCSTAPWRDTSSGSPHHLDGHSCGGPLATPSGGESVLFIGTRFSNLYTAVDTPAESACYV